MGKDKISYEQEIILEKLKRKDGGNLCVSQDSESPKRRIASLHADIGVLQHNIAHNYYQPLVPENRIKKNLKRAARKSIAWFMKPAFDQQTVFNEKTSASLLNLTLLAQGIYSREAEMNSKLKKIEKLDEIKGALEEEKAKTAELQETVRKMMKTLEDAGLKETPTEERASFIKTVYAQSGEDAIIDYILRVATIPYDQVTYLDLGANHAKELSNTFFLYKNHAKGVLVEANPELVHELTLLRRRDIVINKCIGTTSGERVTFYIMSGDGLSTTDKQAAEHFCEINPTLRIDKEVVVETITVTDIIENYLEGKAPTLMSIDIEGMEEQIIRSIDFEKYRPIIIVSEMIDYELRLAEHKNAGILEMLNDRGYIEYAFTGINSIFVDKRYLDKVFGERKS